MSSTRGLSWDDSKSKTVALLAVAALIVATLTAGFAPAAAGVTASEDVRLVVREVNPASTTAETLVERLGGVVGDQLSIIGGFSATLPAAMLDTLTADASVAAVTEDGQLSIDPWSGIMWEAVDFVGEPTLQPGNIHNVTTEAIGVDPYWTAGYIGDGVDVAIIDTGVVPVEGLTYPGKVVNGADLSFESQNPDTQYLDTYGHGTHLAGIIAGRDTTETTISPRDPDGFKGVAPGARIVNVKVGAFNGATDVSQVIAAIDWVVQHRNDNGLNIRVLNLAFGTDSTQDYVLDPLAFAVEQAWNAGIVVVVAAGNDGNANPLRNPASDPFVIAVGSAENTDASRPGLYSLVSSFSNCGTSDRHVDVVAPGKSIISLRNPGSHADVNYPSAVVDDRFFLGSGTSQAAAVVSGAAALIVDQHPNATPDQVKGLLTSTASSVLGSKGKSDPCEGSGMVDLTAAYSARLPRKGQSHTPSTGTGTLEASRGSAHVTLDGVALTGEQDIHGQAWDGVSWSTAAAQGTSWSGGDWNGTSWSGTSWSGTSWSGTSWSGTSWSGTSWSGTSWSGTSWTTGTWNGTSWSGTSWSGTSWSGISWSGTSWSDAVWTGGSWG